MYWYGTLAVTIVMSRSAFVAVTVMDVTRGSGACLLEVSSKLVAAVVGWYVTFVPGRCVKEMEPTVLDTLAVWYLSILASTAQAAMPVAPQLRDTILSQSKYVSEE